MEEKKVGFYQVLCEKHRGKLWFLTLLSMLTIIIGATLMMNPETVAHNSSYAWNCWFFGILLTCWLFYISIKKQRKQQILFSPESLIALVLLAIGLSMFGLGIVLDILFDNEFLLGISLFGILPFLVVISAGLSFISLLLRSSLSRKFLSIAILWLIFSQTLLPDIIWHFEGKEYRESMMCKHSLYYLSMSAFCYYGNNKGWPDQSSWCDSLKPYFKGDDSDVYLCLADKIGPCSYAINENIPADAKELPDDLVLLFESAPGWNQIGGLEDVVTDRHNRPGANIAFADGHVEFVDAEDIPNLHWTMNEQP